MDECTCGKCWECWKKAIVKDWNLTHTRTFCRCKHRRCPICKLYDDLQREFLKQLKKEDVL